MSRSSLLAAHYHEGLKDAQVVEQIQRHYPFGATPYQLAPLDQLHIGGIGASNRLLDLLDPRSLKVLDIGAGLGGLVRLGATRGLQMTGLDITHRFSALNKALGGLGDNIPAYGVVTADARRLPFSDHCFDAVIFQHSAMNMTDFAPVADEARRVLRPSGQLIMHELVEGQAPALLKYPVPWASTSAHSHLLTLEALIGQLRASGFTMISVEDSSDRALAWRARQHEKEQNLSPAVLSPHWVFGERFDEMSQHLLENLANRAINVVEISACC